ncbi:AIPR protein [Marinilactibacillus piezotolerans]|uniref:AIPR protein n=1 Tax=Marinilactibacillus piezotolerans TaxID=258723 RepID=A0A1I4BUZ5_9LACT|nr:AIPR family protein [Marinilactibacillus piezotolerans]SFK72363.1 AIPR protein [Marinilactibacillus piezotolerans]
MNKQTTIKNPIISTYIKDFIEKYEITSNKAKDEHSIFESYINDLILTLYGNDPNASFYDMETKTAFGIDGVAIFVADKFVKSIEDVDDVIQNTKRFEVEFYFSQSKTSDLFNRTEINDFFTGIRRFFNFENCEIPELKEFWETAKYIYTKASKFKQPPVLNTIFASLSPNDINLSDPHLKSAVDLGINDLVDLGMFNKVLEPQFLGLKRIMELHRKINSDLEIVVNMTKTPVTYPKDVTGKIKNGYYGLIKLEEFIKILTDEVSGKKILRKGIFDDNIRYYLGSEEKIDVNYNIKNQLLGKNSYLFGVLNNGITILGDEINLNSEEMTLVNYQIVNGCQTSNVIFEVLDELKQQEDVYIPARFIATNDEETKNDIIKATNSQTTLKPEQLAALAPIQKAIEEYYKSKRQNTGFKLYYERRTEQYRDENIPKTKIINIPFQIKSTSALFLNLPHEVSGQYGKVEKKTRGLLFNNESDFGFINVYYASGLTWYKTERFVLNNYDRKYRRARWHIMMLVRYLCCKNKIVSNKIDKISNKNSELIEKVMLDEVKSNEILDCAIQIINRCLLKQNPNLSIDEILQDRKLFERKETTDILLEYVENMESATN